MTPSRGKPPVGTEEWHKIRKDNHKEGTLHFTFYLTYLNTY